MVGLKRRNSIWYHQFRLIVSSFLPSVTSCFYRFLESDLLTVDFGIIKGDESDGYNLDRIGQLMIDLIMWNDVAKSSLWFGFGSLCFLSSSFSSGLTFRYIYITFIILLIMIELLCNLSRKIYIFAALCR